MIPLAPHLSAWLTDGVIIVTLTRTSGSTPREAGAVMLVSQNRQIGSIGGGQLEFHVTALARTMLDTGQTQQLHALPLGPQMGQCCGGQVEVRLEKAGLPHLALLAKRDSLSERNRPHVLVFGAGHTGLALTRALALLPFHVTLVDDREGQFADLPASITCLRLDDPARALDTTPSGSACVILTHSHALDYRLAEAALKKETLAYVGLIGSDTKRARFAGSFLRNGGSAAQLARLTCPIGGSTLHDGKPLQDKRPEVIAALTAAEIATVLLQGQNTDH